MKPYPFSECLAHEDDPLCLHLLRVAKAAESSVSQAGLYLKLIAFLTSLIHDIGKATFFFQNDRLKEKKKNWYTTHSECSACFAWQLSGCLKLPLWIRISVLIAVLRHHGNLGFDSYETVYGNIRQRVKSDARLACQIENLDMKGIVQWIKPVLSDYFEDEILSSFDHKAFTLQAIRKSFKSIRISKVRECFTETSQVLSFLAGYGSLLAADKIDSAIGGDLKRTEVPADIVSNYKKEKIENSSLSINKLREGISNAVYNEWNQSLAHLLFTLTSPTGSGKTLTVFNAAFYVRKELSGRIQNPPRIIYCLPFTSVIDQNHKVLADILKLCHLDKREDILLKHHHLVPGLYRSEEKNYDEQDAGTLLTETWQSEIVITTFYQFLHSLISAKNSELKRAGQLCGSIVLLDEVQAIPLRYWNTIRRIFGLAAKTLNIRFVLMTATQPLIFRHDDPDIKELLPDHTRYFKKLSRVRLFYHTQKVGLSSFCKQITEDLKKEYQSTLIILNRRKSVKKVFEQLKLAFCNYKIIMLSTDLTPWGRRARIRLIRLYLKTHKPCIVVSTQLVEAGVDVSFPIVHREIAPLDAIIQSSGRSNRHSDDNQGKVHIWELCEENEAGELKIPLWSKVYDVPLMEATIEVLESTNTCKDGIISFEEKDFLGLGQEYFRRCWQRIDQTDLEEHWLNGDFTQLEREFKLIEDDLPKMLCYVSQNSRDKEIWEKYREIYQSDLDALEKKKQFRKIRPKFFERVIHVNVYGKKDPERDPIILLESDEFYSPETGFIKLPEKESSCFF